MENNHIAYFPYPEGKDGEKISEEISEKIKNIINQSSYTTLNNKTKLVVSPDVVACLFSIKDSCEETLRQITCDITRQIKSALKSRSEESIEQSLHLIRKYNKLSLLSILIGDYDEAQKFKANCNKFSRINSFLIFASSIKNMKIETERFSEEACLNNLCNMIENIIDQRKASRLDALENLNVSNKSLEQLVDEEISEESLFSSIWAFCRSVGSGLLFIIDGLFSPIEAGMSLIGEGCFSLIMYLDSSITGNVVTYKKLRIIEEYVLTDLEEHNLDINKDIDINLRTKRILESLSKDDRVKNIENLEEIIKNMLENVNKHIEEMEEIYGEKLKQ